MPAGILENDSMASVREVPWHGLGRILPEYVTLGQMVEQAGLTWEVGFADLVTVTGKPVPQRKATVRLDTGDVLGVVGNRYTIVQNRQAAELLENILDTGEAVAETAGSLFNGRKIWFQAKLTKDIKVGGVDPIDPFIFISNTHDGSASLLTAITPVRVVCMNTLNAATRSASRTFRLQHTSSIKGRVAEARRALDLSYAYYDAFTETMNELANTAIALDKFKAVVDSIFVMPDVNKSSEEEREKVGARRADLLKVYMFSKTVDRGTAYGAYNAVTEWFDHYKNGYRGDQKADNKADAVLFGAGVEFKDRALALIRA